MEWMRQNYLSFHQRFKVVVCAALAEVTKITANK